MDHTDVLRDGTEPFSLLVMRIDLVANWYNLLFHYHFPP